MFKLDGGVDHILVDEAQDTSPDQWAIIKALAEEFFAGDGMRPQNRTIFAVGDRKQSIFSFQGAVPEEFEKMRSFFKSKVESAGRKWNDVPMYISFRSVQAVIDVVNFVLRFDPARKGVVDDGENAAHLSWRKNRPDWSKYGRRKNRGITMRKKPLPNRWNAFIPNLRPPGWRAKSHRKSPIWFLQKKSWNPKTGRSVPATF